MTDKERRDHAHRTFTKLLEQFLGLTESEDRGSFEVHYEGHKIRKIKWNKTDDVDRWEEAS